ncbi:hypothetical protein [Halegenticoccus soli]|nr:hypothetical protein [Halegenticoccus soli]
MQLLPASERRFTRANERGKRCYETEWDGTRGRVRITDARLGER